MNEYGFWLQRNRTQASLDEVLDFSIQNPVRPYYSRDLLKQFLTQLTSSNDLIYDIHSGSDRVAVCVLIDKIENPSGSANLEVIGKSNAIGGDELFAYVFSKLPAEMPIQVGAHEDLKPSDALLEKFGFHFLYHSFEMKKPDVFVPPSQTRTDLKFEKLSLQTFDQYYSVLTKSFKENPETSIPQIEEMKETFSQRLKHKPTGTTLLILDGKIAGFCSVVQDDNDPQNGEVHMVGVLPQDRGRGLGAIALSKAISELESLGCTRCHLSVAAKNLSALNLYTKFGFSVDQTYTSYLRV